MRAATGAVIATALMAGALAGQPAAAAGDDSTCAPSLCVNTSAAMLAFDPSEVPLSQRATTEWNPSLVTGLSEPRLFGATDERGNTVVGNMDDYTNAFQGAGDTGNWYNFQKWPYLGLFYYYSHSALAVPPTGWINAAHRNGVPILGVLTGDCTGCGDADNEFYDDPRAPEILASMATTYGFDGWLFDIEAGADPDKAANVMRQVRALSGPGGRPLLALYYQGGTDDLSDPGPQGLFDAAGLFQSDYGGGHPDQTYAFVVGNDPPNDNPFATSYSRYVYSYAHDTACQSTVDQVSNGTACLSTQDLFTSLSEIRNTQDNSLYQSPGLYALGWERWGGPGLNDAATRDQVQQAMTDLFDGVGAQASGPSCSVTPARTNAVSHYVHPRGVRLEMPFVTRFNTGEGDAFRVAGATRSETAWNGLGLQDVQPTWLCAQGTGQRATVDYTDSYDGGSSLRVAGSGVVGLYDTRIDAPDSAQAIIRFRGPSTPIVVVKDATGQWRAAREQSTSTARGWTTSVQALPNLTQGLRQLGVKTGDGTTVVGEIALVGPGDYRPGSPPHLQQVAVPATGDMTWQSPADTWYANVYGCTSADAEPVLQGRTFRAAFDPRFTLEPLPTTYPRAVVQPVSTAGVQTSDVACAPPEAATGAADATRNRVRFTGTTAPHGATTDVAIAYGATPDLSDARRVSATPSPLPATAGPTSVSATVSGLTPGQRYYYRIEVRDHLYPAVLGRVRSVTVPERTRSTLRGWPGRRVVKTRDRSVQLSLTLKPARGRVGTLQKRIRRAGGTQWRDRQAVAWLDRSSATTVVVLAVPRTGGSRYRLRVPRSDTATGVATSPLVVRRRR